MIHPLSSLDEEKRFVILIALHFPFVLHGTEIKRNDAKRTPYSVLPSSTYRMDECFSIKCQPRRYRPDQVKEED